MTLAEYCELLHEEVSYDVVLAASYLQAKGLKFSIDFGTLNAIKMAEDMYYKEVTED